MKTKNVFAYILLPISIAISSPLIADNKKNNTMEELQNHWQMVISEKDMSKRKEMISIHKSMMMDIEKSNTNHHTNKMSDSHMDMDMGNMMEMNNIMNMHRSMINMME